MQIKKTLTSEKNKKNACSCLGSRYYNPRESVWLSVDPMFDQTPSFSPYAYTLHNPVILTDPTGTSVDTDFKDKKGNLVKHVEDGSNAVFQQTGEGVDLHYEWVGFDESQGGENKVNITSAIQEQQNLNMQNPALKPHGVTYCNFSLENIMRTVISGSEGAESLLIEARANEITRKYAKMPIFESNATLTDAKEAAKAGNLAIYGWINPSGHSGHVGTFSVGDNIAKGATANIGSTNGFQSINADFSPKKRNQVQYFILNPHSIRAIEEKTIPEIIVTGKKSQQ